jgi:hypothetical protein
MSNWFRNHNIINALKVALLGAGLGIMVCITTIGFNLGPGVIIVEDTAYQNYAVFIGAIIGATIGLIFFTCYLIFKHHIRWTKNYLFIFTGLAGALIVFIAYFLVGINAGSYGPVDSTVQIVIRNALILGVISGISCAVSGWIISVMTSN